LVDTLWGALVLVIIIPLTKLLSTVLLLAGRKTYTQGVIELMTVAEVAEDLQVSQEYIRKLCQAGRLGRKVGRQWLITREELQAFKATRRPPGRPPKSAR
jgi:excisionase family DNA binding protein